MKDKRLSSKLKVNSSVYSIRYNRERYVAHMSIKGRQIYITSAGRRDTLINYLKENEPQPNYDPNDKVQRLSAHQRSSIGYINKGREQNNLPLLKIKVRNCMTCKQPFESIEKRICECCRGMVEFHQTSTLSGLDIIE